MSLFLELLILSSRPERSEAVVPQHSPARSGEIPRRSPLPCRSREFSRDCRHLLFDQ
jgi:hypothetical protein